MDLERYWGALNNWTPENEEQRQDQFRAIQAMMQIENLYRKEIMSDEEYGRNINLVVDEEQRQQFEDDHISQSDFDSQMEMYAAVVNEVDNKYGISQGSVSNEFDVEVERKREELIALQAYYRSANAGRANNIMANDNFHTMSSNDIIDYYERIITAFSRNADGRSFTDLVGLGRGVLEQEERDREEAIKEGHRQKIRDRLAKRDKEKIEEAIKQFKIDSGEMKAEIDEVKVKLVLGDTNQGFEATEAVKGLGAELNELTNTANEIKAAIDDFVLETGSADFSMTPAEVENTIKKLKTDLKDLKQKLVDKYDARVELTNNRIAELRAIPDLDPEVANMISGLTDLQKCDVTVNDWKHNSFLSVIDFNKLVEVNKQISEIEERLGIVPPNIELESDMKRIEDGIETIESEIVPGLADVDIAQLNQRLKDVAGLAVDFRTKLGNNIDKLSDEEKENYITRIEDAEANLADLYVRLKEMNKGNDYNELLDSVKKLSDEVNRLMDDVVAFKGCVTKEGRQVFEDRMNKLVGDLEALTADIEARYKDGKLTEEQYKVLTEKVAEVKQRLAEIETKVKDPGMIKDVDIFAFLNGEIDGLEAALRELEEQVEKLDKPIKRENRKQIDEKIKYLEKEIARLEKLAEQHKDKDPKKYNDTMERLKGLKERLNKLNGKYRAKCPLLVRAVKSAKNFFKKHKKICLIIAGLAAMMLLSQHVLIPAMLHGNMMIWQHAPALRGFVEFTNRILGGMIGATQPLKNLWQLSNGVVVNADCAVSSLLKGLAVSGISSTALVAPLVVAIKKLLEKMKKVELKQKLIEEKEKLQGKINEGKEKLKEKMPAKKESTPKNPSRKKADKMTFDELAKLMKEYRESGKTMDEFCAERGLSDDDKNMLLMIEQHSNNHMEEMKNSSKRGR